MRNLSLAFEEWFEETPSNTAILPNQAIFARLYKEVYNKKTMSIDYFTGNRAVIKQQKIDLVESFPTKDRQIVSQLFPIMQNMEMHFQEEFRKVSTPMYWIKFIIFLPQEIMQYLGIKPKLFITHSLNFLIWFIGIAISIFGSDIRNLIISLFK
jgi:hypothetical protein